MFVKDWTLTTQAVMDSRDLLCRMLGDSSLNAVQHIPAGKSNIKLPHDERAVTCNRYGYAFKGATVEALTKIATAVRVSNVCELIQHNRTKIAIEKVDGTFSVDFFAPDRLCFSWPDGDRFPNFVNYTANSKFECTATMPLRHVQFKAMFQNTNTGILWSELCFRIRRTKDDTPRSPICLAIKEDMTVETDGDELRLIDQHGVFLYDESLVTWTKQ